MGRKSDAISIINQAQYMVDHASTLRATAKEFKICKSTVHLNVTDRLRSIDIELHNKVQMLLEKNKAERHIRGGQSFKEKCARLKLQN